jgi:type VI protein secretion system component VasF
MDKQPTRRRRAARTVAVGVAVAALVALLGAGQALATSDERVLERQGRIDRQA